MMQVINNASGDSISKKNNVSLSPNEVIPNILNVYNNPNQNFNTMMYSAMIKVLPLHLKSLMNNNSKLFKENDKYLKNIELKSKFMLLFDTIHKVEYLTYDSNTGEEVWTVLTKNSLDNFTNGSIQICRLINYVNNSLEIQGIKNIELPIYNEYFMLKINNSKPYIPLLYSFIKNKFVPPVVNSQLFNKKNAPFKQVDKYKNTNVKQTLQLLNDKLNKSNIDSSIKFEQNLNKLFNKIKKP